MSSDAQQEQHAEEVREEEVHEEAEEGLPEEGLPGDKQEMAEAERRPGNGIDPNHSAAYYIGNKMLYQCVKDDQWYGAKVIGAKDDMMLMHYIVSFSFVHSIQMLISSLMVHS